MNDKPDLTQYKGLATDTRIVNLKTNLKKLITDNNLTAAKLSKLTGVPKSTLSDWLLGNSPKNIMQVKSVATHFNNMSVDDLVFGDLKSKKIKSSELIESDLLNFGNFDVYLKRK